MMMISRNGEFGTTCSFRTWHSKSALPSRHLSFPVGALSLLGLLSRDSISTLPETRWHVETYSSNYFCDVLIRSDLKTVIGIRDRGTDDGGRKLGSSEGGAENPRDSSYLNDLI